MNKKVWSSPVKRLSYTAIFSNRFLAMFAKTEANPAADPDMFPLPNPVRHVPPSCIPTNPSFNKKGTYC